MDGLVATRRSLHGVAEPVLAGPQYRRCGSVELRATPGGFGTVAQPDLRVDRTDLVAGGRRLPGRAVRVRGAVDDAALGAVERAVRRRPADDGPERRRRGARVLRRDPCRAHSQRKRAATTRHSALNTSSEMTWTAAGHEVGLRIQHRAHAAAHRGDVPQEPEALRTAPARCRTPPRNCLLLSCRFIGQLFPCCGQLSDRDRWMLVHAHTYCTLAGSTQPSADSGIPCG
jgi:hypothetical protein